MLARKGKKDPRERKRREDGEGEDFRVLIAGSVLEKKTACIIELPLDF